MPSVSPKQHRLMEAAAHTPGGFGGVPQSVGREFAAADRSARMDSGIRQHKNMAMGDGPSGDFDVDSIHNRHVPHPDRNMKHSPMSEGSRAKPPSFSRGAGKMNAEHHGDMGPHNHPMGRGR